uniref:NADH dehydrogenase subunit 6 n=1 Tax=Metacanthus pulchellus TaxID=2813417 RepID=A0A8T9ZXU5_9HEMI|nr:NADH dehydrogenase subunit 6 [Metacanthus pulchellus]
MNLIIILMTTLSFIFMFLKHPLTMAMAIIMQTVMAAMFVGMMLKSFWFSYILLIIMLSGMLVLFTYMASISSNEKFSFSFKMMMMSFLLFMLLGGYFFYYDSEMEKMSQIININISLIKLFSSLTMMITILMVIYLFFTMIVVSSIVNIYEGPLRINK